MICHLCGHIPEFDADICIGCEAAITELAQYLHRARRPDMRKIEQLAIERAVDLRLIADAQNFDGSQILREAERYVRGE